ncbi:MAG: Crp/Fnr family transcriptional regulator [Mojavia pulchra JT2-VF2]|jgi:CRP-like cAMP-binding protein|uniref:Crp/Fnr family transcriptional regulator n=1 Tax=Mojavia pulchra JT2-VF2 TaxID=287848 RepID=A0A951UJD5_9NOST|nr:Crp/Fnr family transcriptional regulator [Mojavia pulchra JT2-VF2]
MSVNNNPLKQPENKLLAALPTDEYERLIPHLKFVPLLSGQLIYTPAEPITHVYFPHKAVISLIATMQEGSSVEFALASNEGMAGITTILGDNTTTTTAIVQVPGDGMRMDVDVLISEFKKGGKLQSLLLRYLQALIAEMAQGSACNRLHNLEARFARWLLKVSDRLQSSEFALTQEFIAQMLGVRRSGVSVAAGTFSQAGIISYSRGRIKILNREALEANCCECYSVIKTEFARLLDDQPKRDRG